MTMTTTLEEEEEEGTAFESTRRGQKREGKSVARGGERRVQNVTIWFELFVSFLHACELKNEYSMYPLHLHVWQFSYLCSPINHTPWFSFSPHPGDLSTLYSFSGTMANASSTVFMVAFV